MNAAVPLINQALKADVDEAFAREVLDGLRLPQKTIPCTWLYDHEGSELFEDITRLEAYYPTRSEVALLDAHLPELAKRVGEAAAVIEIGAGAAKKTRLLLRALELPRAYLPIDISADFLLESVAKLRQEFPKLHCVPVIADFTHVDALHKAAMLAPADSPRLVFFPGSTIGNFTREQAHRFLVNLATAFAPNTLLAIGVDATSDVDVLKRAYDDPEGVTAAFDLNLLARINRELGGDFRLEQFRHEARFDADKQRIEMHLVSLVAQDVHVLGERIHFAQGETIHTENSHKFGVERFEDLAHAAGWHSLEIWRGKGHAFEFHLLEHR